MVHRPSSSHHPWTLIGASLLLTYAATVTVVAPTVLNICDTTTMSLVPDRSTSSLVPVRGTRKHCP